MNIFTSFTCAALLTLTLGSSSVRAATESAEQKGERLARQYEAANEGFGAEVSQMELILIDAYNQQVSRELEGKVFEVKGDGDRSLSIFKSPLDVKGTKMLTHSHKKGDDDQWLYLPSAKRVKRISSSNKSGSFMGSEFSYEDLGSQEPEKFTYKWLREEKMGKRKVDVIERIPKDKSGYSKQVMWMVDEINNPAKIEYYDRRQELLKVASFEGYKKYQVGGKTLYRASSIKMDNVQTKKKSIFTWKERKLGASVNESEFEQRALK